MTCLSEVPAPASTTPGGHLWVGCRPVDVRLARLRLGVARSPRLLDPDRAIAALPQSPAVLFLCLGNICRSPFAERYLGRRLADRGIDDIEVASAGFIDGGRPSPPRALETAVEFGVSLEDHESTHVTSELLQRSDLIFVMDSWNYVQLSRRFDWAVDRTWFLNSFADTGGYEIRDPDGEDREVFEAVYDAIASSVDEFVTRLAGNDR